MAGETEREQEDGGSGDGSAGDEAEKDADKNAGKNENAHEEADKLCQASHTTTEQRVARTGRIVSGAAEKGHTLTSTVQVTTAVSKALHQKRDGALLLGDQEEGTSSMTSSYDDQDLGPLNQEIARKVVTMLMSKVGGRYSTELGIDVDAGDAEVERWFLAVTLFHRHLTFDVLKNTFNKLGEAGIVSVGGTLHREEEEVADLLETAGYTTYKHRAAARLRKLAAQLEAEREGKVSTMKHVHDMHELHRQISNLHGLSANTASIFLRELRGVWPGAATEYDRRTTRAAMHLRIVDFEQSEDASNKSSVLHSHTLLKRIAQGAGGADERDLEVALVKLGLSHERHYRECPGGLVCHFLISPDEPSRVEGKRPSGGTSTLEDIET